MCKHGLEKWKWAVWLCIFIGHLVLFPPLFYPDYKLDALGMHCGMPIVGIAIAFFIFGGGATLMAHLAYHLTTGKQFNNRNI